MVVGWYHSYPGSECWLSSVDINAQQVNLLKNLKCQALMFDFNINLSNPSTHVQ